MSTKVRSSDSLAAAIILFAIAILASPIHASNDSAARKLDETTPAGDPVKCAPCLQNPPPPSPPLPSPPPACPPPPALPPPPPPKKSTPYCPPPPSAPTSYLYITGPPGNLYPVDQGYGSAPGKLSTAKLSGLVAFGLLGFLIF